MRTISKLGVLILFAFSFCQCQPKYDNEALIEETYQNNIKDSIIATGWYYIVEPDSGYIMDLNGYFDFYDISLKPIIVQKNVLKTEKFKTNMMGMTTGLKMYFDEQGKKAWSEATGRSIGKQLGFVLDNKLIQVGTIQAQIDNGVSSIANREFTIEDINKIAKRLKNK